MNSCTVLPVFGKSSVDSLHGAFPAEKKSDPNLEPADSTYQRSVCTLVNLPSGACWITCCTCIRIAQVRAPQAA